MKDASGRIIGIRFRTARGDKSAIKGSRNGLFIPVDMDLDLGERLLICEGPTDCAALLGLGFKAIGRPSCKEGGDLLIDVVRCHDLEEVVVVSDNDKVGQEGALSLGRSLRLHVPVVRVVIPPAGTKDARAWVLAGVDAEPIGPIIENTPPMTLTIKGEDG